MSASTMPYAIAASSVHQLEAYTRGDPDAPSQRSTSRCTTFATRDDAAEVRNPSLVSTSTTSAGTEGSAATSPGLTSL